MSEENTVVEANFFKHLTELKYIHRPVFKVHMDVLSYFLRHAGKTKLYES